MRAPPMILPCILCLTAAACSQFPEVDATVSDTTRDAPYPDLVPIGTLQERMTQSRISPKISDTVESRAARLKRRAAALKRRDVVGVDTQARLDAGVQ